MKTREPKQLNDSVYEFYRPDGEFSAEIVAFHGLRFSDYRDAYETTWELENGNGCWLRDSLPVDFQHARILSVSYDSCAKVSDKAGNMSFSNLGTILVQDIIHLAQVGQRGCPVVLVGYCLGGLIIKQLCTEAEKQCDQAPDGSSKGRLDNFLTNVRVIASIDTPQAGSALGDYLVKCRECEGLVLEYLSKSSPALRKLNSEFDSLVGEREWARVCFRHSWITKDWDSLQLPESGLEVVAEGSARLGKETVFFTVPADHSTKAWGSSSPRDLLTDFLAGIIREAEIPNYPQSESNRRLPTIVKGKGRSDRRERVSDSLYRIYEPVTDKHAKVELVFFPGSFKGDSYKTTWMAEDNKHCWLQSWLPDAFPEARIFAVSYPANLDLAESIDLFLLCENLIAEIILNRKDRGLPLILVGHCLGGIVIKMLCNQLTSMSDGDQDQGSCQELLRSIRGIGYYATSHFSYCSCYEQAGVQRGTVPKVQSGVVNKVFLPEEGELGRINAEYLYNVTNLDWKELALGETQPTQQGSRKIVFVDESSASHGIRRNSFFPVAADHFSICKPKGPSSNSFQYLVHFIHTTMSEAQYRNMNVRRKKRRGVAIVISMESGRPGSVADRHRLDDMADYLKFKPILVLNRGASSFPLVINQILEAEKEAMEQDECILVCVNAHGAVEDGIHYIYGSEEKGEEKKGKEKIQLISEILKPIADCPVLAGKPKVFVVNSCRGIRGETDATTGLPKDQNDLQAADDCLLMYSTKLDTESWRRETGYEQGTLFVSELTYHICLLYQTTDVQDIFKMVEEKVPELARRSGVEQSPVLYTTLRKRLSWRPR